MKPNKVNICGKPHDIVYDPEMEDDGIFIGDRRLIKVSCKRHTIQEDLIERLFHEVFHAISDEYDLSLTENQVRTLGIAWADVLTRNRWLKQ